MWKGPGGIFSRRQIWRPVIRSFGIRPPWRRTAILIQESAPKTVPMGHNGPPSAICRDSNKEEHMSKDIAVGQMAHELSIPDQHGKPVTLKSFKGKQVVLYFYPKDDTPGCTKESCDFRDVESQILRAGGMIVGVSLDGKESHQKFIKKFGLPFPLLSDEDAAISKAYGVYKEKSMYGRKYWGIERSTFIIDTEGKVKAIF